MSTSLYKLIIFSLSCISFQCFSQVTFDYLHHKGIDEYPEKAHIIELPDGSIIYQIASGTYTPYNYNITSYKLNSSGNLVDSLHHYSFNHTRSISNMFIINNYIYLIGNHKNNNANFGYTFLSKLDYDLNIIYDTVISINQNINNWTTTAKYLNNGLFITAGISGDTSYNTTIMLIDTLGSIIQHNIDTSFFEIKTLINLSSTKYHAISTNGNVLHINKSSLQVQQQFPQSNIMYTYGAALSLSDSSYTIAGYSPINDIVAPNHKDLIYLTYDTLNQLIDTFILSNIDTNQRIAYYKSLDFNKLDSAYIGGTHVFFLDTFTNPSPFVNQNRYFLLANINTQTGTVNWQKFYGGFANFDLYHIKATSDGGCILIGSYFDWKKTNHNNRDVYIIKVDKNGNYNSNINININSSELNKAIIVYPNPTHNLLYINTGLINNLKIEFYSVSGKLVKSNTLKTGINSVKINQFPNGVYLYKIYNKTSIISLGKVVKK